MTHPRAAGLGIDTLAVIAGGSTIAAWQEQLEWGLKILATSVAIAAGIVSLLYHRRHRRETKAPFPGRMV